MQPSDLGSSSAQLDLDRSSPSACSYHQYPASNSPRKPRNLVVNIDGTSNQFGLMNTNVIELYSRLASDEDQLSYYNSGIGTYAQPSWRSWNYWAQVVDNSVDLAIAWNFERVIIGAYRWLSERYRPGDRIFLFGFSRGAYQVRVLAGMIEKVGLIHEGNEEQIPFAFELYAGLKFPGNDDAARHFKKTFSTEGVRVHFVGVWDTVSSIGIVREKVLPLVESSKHICVFRHALALDERRVKFLPECMMRKGKEPDTNAKEVWFAGSHSDVGGGNRPNTELNLESAPLLWMEHEAAIAGLRLRQSSVEWKIRDLEKSKTHESLKGVWWVFERLPVLRQSRLHPTSTSRFPHHGKGRPIYAGQKFHASIAFKGARYEPKAVFRLNGAPFPPWNTLISQGPSGKFSEASGGWSDLLELDLFDLAAAPGDITRLETLQTENDILHFLNRLSFLATLNDGKDVIRGTSDNHRIFKSLLDDTKQPVTVFLATAKLFAKLARSTEGHRTSSLTSPPQQLYEAAVINPVVIEKVVTSLNLNDEAAADTIAELAHLLNARRQILDPRLAVIPRLVDMLRSARGAAANAIVALAKYDGARALIFDSEAIPVLVDMLESDYCEPAANAIADLAQDEQALNLILELHTIQKLGGMLELTDRSSAAVYALAQLTKHAKARQLIVNDYGYRLTTAAVTMLVGDDRGISVHALAVLVDSDADGHILGWMLNRTPKSLQKDVVIPLTSILESKHDGLAAAQVLSALGHADMSDRVRILVLSTNAPSVLMNMLGDDGGSAAAVKALAAILHADDLAKLQIQDQSINALVELLETERNSAAIVLARLLALSDAQEIIRTKHGHVIATLTHVLQDSLKMSRSPVSEPVMKGLLAVARIGEVRARLLELNLISMLLTAFADEHAASTVPKVAVDTIKQLIKEYPDVRDACSEEVIKQLAITLGNKSHVRACQVIQSLVQHGSTDSRHLIGRSDVIPILLLLSHQGILARAIESDRCLVELAKFGVGPRRDLRGKFLWFCKRAATGSVLKLEV